MNNEENNIVVDGINYSVSELSEQTLEYLEHVHDLQNKVNEGEHNLKQLRVAMAAFLSMFKNSLPKKEITNDADQEV